MKRIIESPQQILERMAHLFEKRNAVYKDNFRVVGVVMHALFDGDPPRLESSADYARWHLFELVVVKLTRYARQYNVGGHKDSIEDQMVYLAMVAMLDQERAGILEANVADDVQHSPGCMCVDCQ